jgi:predicted O-methyltransferase YrrM
MNIEKALTVEGWMSEVELRWLAETAATVPEGGVIVEIGSYLGRSACALAANTRATVYCVDMWNHAWDGWQPPGPHSPNYSTFCFNTAEFDNITPIHQPSVLAAREMFESGSRADMIFIDAAHDEMNVRRDIESWRPLLKEGGVLAGHDYGFTGWPDVMRVVDELIPGAMIVDTIWIAP